MLKYIFAATLFSLTFGQASRTTTATTASKSQNCIPRPQASSRNLVQQTPSTSQYSDAVLKSATTKIESEWIAYVGTTDKSVPPPPPSAWLKYKSNNKLSNSAKIPTSFFQKWRQDYKSAPQYCN